MGDIRFGTDGWRGTIAGDFTFDNVRRATQGVAEYLHATGAADRGFIIGYDRRFASEHLAAAAAEVMAANDIPVFLTDQAVPTPVVAFSVLNRGTAGAIIITASHNPPTDNGFKLRDHRGVAMDPEDLQQIEDRIPETAHAVKRSSPEAGARSGRIEMFDPIPPYLEYLKQRADLDAIRRARIAVVHDAMWGVGAGWLNRLLAGDVMTVGGIRQLRNPIFPGMIRPEPILPNIDELVRAVRDTGSDVGIAHDGDADRMGVVDENGSFLTPLDVGNLLALYLIELGKQRGPIVKELSSSVVLDILCRKFELDLVVTPIGPKYIGPKVIDTGAMLGATESGGYLFPTLPERDGILASLYFLDLMARTGKRPSELLEWLYEVVGARYYFGRVDTRFPPDQRERIWERTQRAQPGAICGLQVRDVSHMDPRGIKFHLEDDGWLLVRFSGTEPMLRVYCETTRKALLGAMLDEGLRIAGLKT